MGRLISPERPLEGDDASKRGKKTWRTRGVQAGVQAQMRDHFPRRLRRRRALGGTLFFTAKRKLFCRAPGQCLLTQSASLVARPHLQRLSPVARNSAPSDVNRARLLLVREETGTLERATNLAGGSGLLRDQLINDREIVSLPYLPTKRLDEDLGSGSLL